MSAPLASYVDPADIRERLYVLHNKAWRIRAYNATCVPGAIPEADLLDEKQQETLALRRREGRPFPRTIQRTLGQTIQVLQNRLNGSDTSGSAATEKDLS